MLRLQYYVTVWWHEGVKLKRAEKGCQTVASFETNVKELQRRGLRVQLYFSVEYSTSQFPLFLEHQKGLSNSPILTLSDCWFFSNCCDKSVWREQRKKQNADITITAFVGLAAITKDLWLICSLPHQELRLLPLTRKQCVDTVFPPKNLNLHSRIRMFLAYE